MTTFPQLKTKFVLAFVDKTWSLGTLRVSKTPKPNLLNIWSTSFLIAAMDFTSLAMNKNII
jgi:hypothetical protein